MKQFAVVLLALFIASFTAESQLRIARATVKNGATYANSQNDTTLARELAGANIISASMASTDTCAADVYIQYSKNGSTGWTTIVTDSLVTLTGTGATSEYSIRDSDSDAIDGAMGYLRAVIVFRAAANGVAGTTTYTFRYYYR
jgi:hypothetical protein